MQAALLERRLDIKNRKYYFHEYKNCFIGSEAVKSIMDLELATNEDESLAFGRELLEKGLVRHVEKKHTFNNGHFFYQFTMKFHQTFLTMVQEEKVYYIEYKTAKYWHDYY